MQRPRVIYMGTPSLRGAQPHPALAERPDLCTLVAVMTQPDRPAGRGRKMSPSAVKAAATARGLPVLDPSQNQNP